jgi:hypothetical protein
MELLTDLHAKGCDYLDGYPFWLWCFIFLKNDSHGEDGVVFSKNE